MNQFKSAKAFVSIEPKHRITIQLLDEIKLIHVFYAHYIETNDALSVENFLFFMNFGYKPCEKGIFFTFVFNRDKFDSDIINDLSKIIGEKLAFKLRECSINDNTIELSSIRNTKIIVRKNQKGGDLCGYVDMMKSQFWTKNENLFYYYFFINSSVRGPFLPNYWLRSWYFI